MKGTRVQEPRTGVFTQALQQTPLERPLPVCPTGIDIQGSTQQGSAHVLEVTPVPLSPGHSRSREVMFLGATGCWIHCSPSRLGSDLWYQVRYEHLFPQLRVQVGSLRNSSGSPTPTSTSGP